MVAACLLRAAETLKLYELHAWVIMSNHVHLFIKPHARWRASIIRCDPTPLMKQTRFCGVRGSFWRQESYDHWSRGRSQSGKIIAYIEENPVKAGIVERAEDYRWSSAFKVA